MTALKGEHLRMGRHTGWWSTCYASWGYRTHMRKPGSALCSCNPSPGQAEGGRFLWLADQPVKLNLQVPGPGRACLKKQGGEGEKTLAADLRRPHWRLCYPEPAEGNYCRSPALSSGLHPQNTTVLLRPLTDLFRKTRPELMWALIASFSHPSWHPYPNTSPQRWHKGVSTNFAADLRSHVTCLKN